MPSTGLPFAPAQGTGYAPNPSTPMQAGTSPLECWYSGVVNQTAHTTASHAVNTLTARTIVIGRDSVIDQLGFEVTTGGGAGSVARCGIYKATSPLNIYPGDRVVDGGEKDTTTTGTKTTTSLSVFVRAGLYWFVILTGVAAPTLRVANVGGVGPIIGVPTTMGASPNIHLSVALAYAALPATFTASATAATTARAHMYIRFSA